VSSRYLSGAKLDRLSIGVEVFPNYIIFQFALNADIPTLSTVHSSQKDQITGGLTEIKISMLFSGNEYLRTYLSSRPSLSLPGFEISHNVSQKSQGSYVTIIDQ